jgi:hypothetical protein
MVNHKVTANIISIAYLFLQAIFIVSAVQSYKNSNSWFDIFTLKNIQNNNFEKIHPAFSSNQYINSNIIGKCLFQIPKFISLIILFVIFVSFFIMIIVGYTKHNEKESMKDLYLSLAIIQIVIITIPFIITIFSNHTLLFKSLPFYITQIGIILIFFALYFTI